MRKAISRLLSSFGRDRGAVTAIEYAMIGGCVFLAIIAAVTGVGVALGVPFATIGTALH